MIGTIPTVSRAVGTGRWLAPAGVYVTASTMTATLVGVMLSFVGLPVTAALGPRLLTLISAGVALAGGLAELGLLTIPWPQHRSQVPATWRSQFPVEVTAALYGGILGIGLLTTISFASFYVLVVWTLLSGNVLEGAVMFGLFGLTRGAPAALLSPFLGQPGAATALIKALMPFHHHIGRVTGWALISLAAFTTVIALR